MRICIRWNSPSLFYWWRTNLNSEIIIYTINKIIEEDIPVYSITLMTNGQLFVPELVQVLNKYNKYGR